MNTSFARQRKLAALTKARATLDEDAWVIELHYHPDRGFHDAKDLGKMTHRKAAQLRSSGLIVYNHYYGENGYQAYLQEKQIRGLP